METKKVWKQRSVDSVKKRASGNKSDRITKEGFKIFTPAEGENVLRILPNRWDPENKHYGYDVYTHYQVGPDKAQYLCLEKMRLNGGVCPVCEQGYKPAKTEADVEPAENKDRKKQLKDYAYSLMPKQAAAMWVIDRKHEDLGPQIYLMTAKMDRKFAALGVDPSDGSLIEIESLTAGYDIIFTRIGKGLTTEYTGKQVARRATALGKDEWVTFIEKNPLPNCFISFSFEYIDAVYHAKLPNTVDADGEETGSAEDTQTAHVQDSNDNTTAEDSHEEVSTESNHEAGQEANYTYEDLASLTTAELVDFAKSEGILNILDIKKAVAANNVLNVMCSKMGITVPGVDSKPAEVPAQTPPADSSSRNTYKERLKQTVADAKA